MYKILLGSDPELFVKNGKGEFISAHDLIPGTKAEPYIVRCGAVQVDGVAAEYNINPAETEDEFVNNHLVVRARLEEMVKEADPSYHLVAEPTATFSPEYFQNLPIEATLLGCTPDYNAYTEDQNTPPETNEPFRTGSGHIHIGWGSDFDVYDPGHFLKCCHLVRQLDAVLYPASHIWDTDFKRRTLYGKRGAFRPKSYGLEWRPLSNAFLRSEETMRLVYRMAYGASDLFLNKGVKLYEE